MKNCCVPTPTEQKKLLKVLTCLYENYILNQTPATDSYFANPTSENYINMVSELNAIKTIINIYISTNKLFCVSYVNVELWSAVAQGMVQYNSAIGNDNTFNDAIANNIKVNQVISNVGVLKTVQKLNNDDCVDKAYQVTPVTNTTSCNEPFLYTNFTQASLVERVGCSGISNLGFLGMTLQVEIEAAPFNNCYVPKC
jgi:hypothetical protein